MLPTLAISSKAPQIPFTVLANLNGTSIATLRPSAMKITKRRVGIKPQIIKSYINKGSSFELKQQDTIYILLTLHCLVSGCFVFFCGLRHFECHHVVVKGVSVGIDHGDHGTTERVQVGCDVTKVI